MRKIVAGLLIVLMASCASIGSKGLADPATMSSIIENKTKQTEIQSMLGDPMGSYRDPNGDVVWQYTLAKSQVFTGTSATNATFRFRNGLLVEKTVMNPKY